MATIQYLPATADVATNLSAANVANMTGDVTHTIGGEITAFGKTYSVIDAKHISVHVVYASLNGSDVFKVLTTLKGSTNFICENTDETTPNATQATITGIGSHIFHFVPSNYQDIQLFFDKASTAGTVDVTILFQF